MVLPNAASNLTCIVFYHFTTNIYVIKSCRNIRVKRCSIITVIRYFLDHIRPTFWAWHNIIWNVVTCWIDIAEHPHINYATRKRFTTIRLIVADHPTKRFRIISNTFKSFSIRIYFKRQCGLSTNSICKVPAQYTTSTFAPSCFLNFICLRIASVILNRPGYNLCYFLFH